MSTRNTVINQYEIWLNRDPNTIEEQDPNGINHYVNLMDYEGWTVERVANDMNSSDDFYRTAGEQVKTWYQDILGRDPLDPNNLDQEGYDHYIDQIRRVGFKQLGPIQQTFYDSDEYKKNQEEDDVEASNDNKIIIHGKTYTLPVPGQGGDLFGGADYYYLLEKAGSGADGSDKSYRDREALEDVRENIMYWMDHGQGKSFLAENNKPGAESGTPSGKGLYDRIKQSGVNDGGIQFSGFADHSKHFDGDSYGIADVLAARAGGHTEFNIYSHMRRNKNLWDKEGSNYDSHRSLYNNIRGELIRISNTTGNLHGKTETKDGVEYSWFNTLQNPLWQEIGAYMKDKDVEGLGDKDLNWWQTNKKAYEEIRKWQEERHSRFDFIEVNDRGNLVKTLTTDEQLQQLIGVQGGEGEVTPPGSTEPGKYWSYWGEEGPGALNKPMLMAAGTGLGWEFEDEDEIDSKLDKLEERFLKEMYVGVPSTSMDPKQQDLGPPKFTQAKDSWGLDIVRKNMRPEDWEEDWFDKDDGQMNRNKFQDLAYGDLEDIDWAYYAENKLYQQAQEDLGMDAVIDEVKEIRQANVWVQARLATGVDSDLVEDHIKYKPVFDSSTATPYTPQDLKIEGYTPKSLDVVDRPDDPPDAPTINVVPPDIERPDNLPNDLKIMETV